MIRRLSWRPPVFAAGGFLALALALFKGVGYSWTEAADAALSVLAGIRPQMANLEAAHGNAAVVVMTLAALGFALRIFLIAYCAAYLVRRNLEKNEMKELLRLLRDRSPQPESGRVSMRHLGNLN